MHKTAYYIRGNQLLLFKMGPIHSFMLETSRFQAQQPIKPPGLDFRLSTWFPSALTKYIPTKIIMFCHKFFVYGCTDFAVMIHFRHRLYKEKQFSVGAETLLKH